MRDDYRSNRNQYFDNRRAWDNYPRQNQNRNFRPMMADSRTERYYDDNYDREINRSSIDDRDSRKDFFQRNQDDELSATASKNVGKGPKGWKKSDVRILEDVCECLAMDPYIDASEMEVTVDDRVVVLSGKVIDKRAKRHAEEIVESISGVHDVRNNLKVDSGIFSSSRH